MTTELRLRDPHVRIAPLPASRRPLVASIARWYARRRFGRVPGVVDAYAHSPALLVAAGCFEIAAGRAHAVDARLKSLAELKVAALVGCPFCLDLGSSLARGHGVTEAQVRALGSYPTSDCFSPIERLTLDLATAMTQAPVRVSDELVSQLHEVLGDEGLVELTGAIAWENFRARMNHALGLTAEGFSEGAFCAVPEAAGRALEPGS